MVIIFIIEVDQLPSSKFVLCWIMCRLNCIVLLLTKLALNRLWLELNGLFHSFLLRGSRFIYFLGHVEVSVLQRQQLLQILVVFVKLLVDCRIVPSFRLVSCRRLAVCSWVVAEAIGHLFIGQLSIFLIAIGQISKVEV